MKRELAGILFDLDETLYSREEAFWTWIELEARTGQAGATLDRQRVAALDHWPLETIQTVTTLA